MNRKTIIQSGVVLLVVLIGAFSIYFATTFQNTNTENRSRASGTNCAVRKGCSTDHPGYGYQYTPTDYPTCSFGPPWPTWPGDYTLNQACGGSASTVDPGWCIDRSDKCVSYNTLGDRSVACKTPYTACGAITSRCIDKSGVCTTIKSLADKANICKTPYTDCSDATNAKMWFFNTQTKTCARTDLTFLNIAACEASLTEYASTYTTKKCFVSLDTCAQGNNLTQMWFYNTQTNACTKTAERYTSVAACEVNLAQYNATISTGKCFESRDKCTCKRSDLNCDSHVDIFDYNLLVTDFGKTGAKGFVRADIDKSGVVDIFDYNILVTDFKK